MKIRVGFVVAVVLSATGFMTFGPATSANATTTPAPTEQADTLALYAQFRMAYDKMMAGNYADARTDIEAVIQMPMFGKMPARGKSAVYLVLAQCQMMMNDIEAAYTNQIEAGKLSPETRDGVYWFSLGMLANATGRKEEAVEAFTTVAQTSPDTFANYGKYADNTVRDIALKAYKLNDDQAHFTALADALVAADYHPNNPLWSTELMRFRLFEAYIARGQEDEAKALLAGFQEPNSLIGLRADKRYQRFVPQGPGKGDFITAQNEYIAAMQRRADTNPRLLEGQQFLAQALISVNRPKDALVILDKAEARIKAAPAGRPVFDDQEEQAHWLAMVRSQALKQLPGVNVEDKAKAIEAAQVRADALADQAGGDVVSEKINLAEVFYENGANQKAIDTLARLDISKASAYGKMAAQEAWVCGYAGLGDTANMTKALDYMKAHSADGPRLLRSALLCANDFDGLASQLISNLDDPVTRNGMLVELQNYTAIGNAGTFAEAQCLKAQQVIARADVQAAVARYGVIETYPAVFSQY